VLLEQEPLDAQLDALGLIRAGRDVRALAALVVDRGDLAVLGLDQVDPSDQAEALGGERDRAGVQALVSGQRLGLGEGACSLEAAMAPAALATPA
jgi:hypothetical protein